MQRILCECDIILVNWQCIYNVDIFKKHILNLFTEKYYLEIKMDKDIENTSVWMRNLDDRRSHHPLLNNGW